jgi:hypothetical protein
MSTRAHRVIKIETSGESFSLWHDEEIMDWLEGHTLFFDPLNEDACGLTEVSIKDLKTMLLAIGGKIDKDVKKAIEQDIQFAEDQGDECVQYYCF